SLIASTRGVGLLPAYAQNFLPWSVTSRPLQGDPPTIDLVLGYKKSNESPILKLLLSRLDELIELPPSRGANRHLRSVDDRPLTVERQPRIVRGRRELQQRRSRTDFLHLVSRPCSRCRCDRVRTPGRDSLVWL